MNSIQTTHCGPIAVNRTRKTLYRIVSKGQVHPRMDHEGSEGK